jgi:hypothetical protein
MIWIKAQKAGCCKNCAVDNPDDRFALLLDFLPLRPVIVTSQASFADISGNGNITGSTHVNNNFLIRKIVIATQAIHQMKRDDIPLDIRTGLTVISEFIPMILQLFAVGLILQSFTAF